RGRRLLRKTAAHRRGYRSRGRGGSQRHHRAEQGTGRQRRRSDGKTENRRSPGGEENRTPTALRLGHGHQDHQHQTDTGDLWAQEANAGEHRREGIETMRAAPLLGTLLTRGTAAACQRRSRKRPPLFSIEGKDSAEAKAIEPQPIHRKGVHTANATITASRMRITTVVDLLVQPQREQIATKRV